MTLIQVLRAAVQRLSCSETPHLDAAVLLATVLQVPRAYLIAHGEEVIAEEHHAAFMALLQRRQQGEPLAYLTGHKEFWSLDLHISAEVLVPRPETELLVEWVLDFFPADRPVRLAELGTGSGALAVALAKERPQWQIYATDLSAAALALAQRNAQQHHVQPIQFFHGDWCQALPPQILFDVIVSNPPYLSLQEWQHAEQALRFEPVLALVGGDDGLAALKKIITTAKDHLVPGGCLLLEHGCQQAAPVRQLLLAENYTAISSYCDLAGKERATKGQFG